MNRYQIILPMVAALIAAIGQLLLRMGMLKVGVIGINSIARPATLIISLISQPLLWVAVPLYMIGFFVWLIVLSRIPLSIAYPMLATTYIVIPFLSMLILHENILWQHWLGIMFIFAGVIVIGISSHPF